MCEVEASVSVDCRRMFSTSFSNRFSMTRFRRRRSTMPTLRSIKLTRHGIPDNRVEPCDDIQPATRMLGSGHEPERGANADKSAERCQYCQHCEWYPHRRWRLVRDVRAVCVVMVFMRVSVCGDVVRAVEYSGYTVNYCATCQTGGKVLADNTTSRFLK